MKTIIKFACSAAAALLMIMWSQACSQSRGFALPEGDISAGKEVFLEFQCNQCHSTTTVDFKGTDDNLHVALGGEVGQIKSYGQLVTSVINPSHKIAFGFGEQVNEANKMRNFNEELTVQEMVDLVTYLQSEYEIPTPYEYYYPY